MNLFFFKKKNYQVWTKLVQQNSSFFDVYFCRIQLKEQIKAMNELVFQQGSIMYERGDLTKSTINKKSSFTSSTRIGSNNFFNNNNFNNNFNNNSNINSSNLNYNRLSENTTNSTIIVNDNNAKNNNNNNNDNNNNSNNISNNGIEIPSIPIRPLGAEQSLHGRAIFGSMKSNK